MSEIDGHAIWSEIIAQYADQYAPMEPILGPADALYSDSFVTLSAQSIEQHIEDLFSKQQAKQVYDEYAHWQTGDPAAQKAWPQFQTWAQQVASAFASATRELDPPLEVNLVRGRREWMVHSLDWADG